MDIAEHIAALRREGEPLADVAGAIAPSTPVPACPGWTMRDLLAHLGYVHRWAAGYVAEARTEIAPGAGHEDMLRLAPADDALTGWFREGHARLVSVLEAADPAVRCWTFLRAPSPLAFWARRQAHETAIHRVDAQLAAGEAPGPIGARFAADGIDELLTGFASRSRRRQLLADCHPATLVFRVTGGDIYGGPRSWTIDVGAERTLISRGIVPAGPAAGSYCEVSGPAPDLYLMMWNRRPADGLDQRGDPALLSAWAHEMRVRWR